MKTEKRCSHQMLYMIIPWIKSR